MKRYSSFALYLSNYVALAFIYLILTRSLPGSILTAIIACLSLFSFRTFDKENLSDFNQLLVRSFIALLFANIINYVIARLIYLSFFGGVGRVRLTPLSVHTIVSTFAVSIMSYYFFKFLKKRVRPGSYAVIGRKNELNELLKEIEQKSDEYRFVQFIESKEDIKRIREDLAGIIVADYSMYESLQPYLSPLNNFEIIFLPHIAESVLKRIPLALIDRFKAYYETSFNRVLESAPKRILDIVFATVGLIVASPIMLIIAILILLEDGRPVIYRQKRVGRDSKEFEFIKFRSLKQEGFDPSDPNRNIEQRMLKIGRFIRKYRLDELPQLWLVLKGTMSLVGPRPEMVEYHLQCASKIAYYHYRLKLKPGLTGWAQINYRHTSTLEEYKTKLEYDLYYVKNHSVWLDLNIVLRTFEAVIFKRGAR
ncbi:hypothetical protein AS159_02535 [Thermotoga sp. Ku-13t]|uniref:exopolysaccharide biosynthesis polyprenyl glycosylphosphotransferase n=1 Tax=Thermotoga sp. Ku-13t TaxID=1755813 RepID=UPI0013EC6913|nr:exopolysaccharide biosynthesis polyprenyl glycosylphosphotransferase [Thermotoga sp. Ku-13t]KAF2958583.1 hypothetical protein AS159_02535 [Thermotoga sp. Ku-13t]